MQHWARMASGGRWGVLALMVCAQQALARRLPPLISYNATIEVPAFMPPDCNITTANGCLLVVGHAYKPVTLATDTARELPASCINNNRLAGCLRLPVSTARKAEASIVAEQAFASHSSLVQTTGGSDIHIAGDTSSVTFVDYDGDGDMDLHVVNYISTYLFQNRLNESGRLAFVDVASTAGLSSVACLSRKAVWADVDTDGDMDVLLVCDGDDHLLQNRGDGTFATLQTFPNQFGDDAAFADMDNDGCALRIRPDWP